MSLLYFPRSFQLSCPNLDCQSLHLLGFLHSHLILFCFESHIAAFYIFCINDSLSNSVRVHPPVAFWERLREQLMFWNVTCLKISLFNFLYHCYFGWLLGSVLVLLLRNVILFWLLIFDIWLVFVSLEAFTIFLLILFYPHSWCSCWYL